MTERGICMVLSAPSGGGKTTLIREMLRRFPGLRHSISYTTRMPRNDNSDAGDYHFIDTPEFQRMITAGEFLEWAEVHGCLYGTSRKDLEALLNAGNDVIMDIDIQGAGQLMERFRDAVYVFILPPSFQALEARLRNRHSESETSLKERLKNARGEMNRCTGYNYLVINDDLDIAVDQLRSILIAEHLSMKRRSVQDRAMDFLRGIEE